MNIFYGILPAALGGLLLASTPMPTGLTMPTAGVKNIVLAHNAVADDFSYARIIPLPEAK